VPRPPLAGFQEQAALRRLLAGRPADSTLVAVLFASLFFDTVRLQVLSGLFNIRPSFVVAAVVFPILASRWVASRWQISRTPLLPALLGLDACFFLSTAINSQSPVQLRGFITCALLLFNIVFFIVVYWHARRIDQGQRVLRLIVALGAMYSLLGMLVLLLNQLGFAPAHRMVEFRTLGNWTMGDQSQDVLTPRPWFLEPNIGSYLAAIGVMALGRTLISSVVERWFYGICAALIFTGVLLTYSRGAWLGAIAGGGTIMVSLIWHRGEVSIRPVALLGLLAAFAISLTVLVTEVGSIKTVVVGRLENILNVGQGTGQQRFEYWSTITRDALRQPILGHGANAYQLLLPRTCPAPCPRFVAENATVEIFHTSGVIGLAFYVAIAVLVALLFRNALARAGQSHALRGAAIVAIGGYVALLVSSQLNPSFWGNMYWAIFGLAVALLSPHRLTRSRQVALSLARSSE
jgi:O-antigen ligase